MAFEIPLDADRVDDMNLFSTFVRAPVIGTLLWILGGSKAQQEVEDEGKENRLDDGDSSDCAVRNSSSSTANGVFGKHARTSLKKAAPSLAGSEISDCELTESLDAISLYGYNGSTTAHCIQGMAKKELSWSDDVGKELVIYETESTIHEPKPASEQPIRPALVRSRSIRADADHLVKSQLENKFLPSHRQNRYHMKHNSMPYPMPSQNVEPYSSGNNGYDSPQWGWYINTTPPSPEMFHSSRQMKSRKPIDSTSDTSEASRDSAAHSAIGSSLPNPVFKCLQDKHRANPTAWPSVPL